MNHIKDSYLNITAMIMQLWIPHWIDKKIKCISQTAALTFSCMSMFPCIVDERFNSFSPVFAYHECYCRTNIDFDYNRIRLGWQRVESKVNILPTEHMINGDVFSSLIQHIWGVQDECE